MKIVCLEGTSGSGKTTQYQALGVHYSKSGLRYLAFTEKNHEPFKSVVEEWTLNNSPNTPFTTQDVQRFARARAETINRNVFAISSRLDLVFMDRSLYTSAIYQSNSDLNPDEIIQINMAYGVPIPGLGFLLECPPEICFERSTARNNVTGKKHFLSNSPEKIRDFRNKYRGLLSQKPEIVIVNSNRPVEKITEDLVSKIDLLINL